MPHKQFVQLLCFKDVHQFRAALKNYHIKNRRDYQYLRNDKDRVMVSCKTEGPLSFLYGIFSDQRRADPLIESVH